MKSSDAELRTRFATALSPDAPADQVLVLCSLDERNFPHFSLFSRFELIVIEGVPYLYLRDSTHSATNLRERRKGALASLETGQVWYAKFQAFRVRQSEGFDLFELELQAFKVDHPSEGEREARLAAGLRFEEGPVSRERRQELRRRMTRLISGSASPKA